MEGRSSPHPNSYSISYLTEASINFLPIDDAQNFPHHLFRAQGLSLEDLKDE